MGKRWVEGMRDAFLIRFLSALALTGALCLWLRIQALYALTVLEKNCPANLSISALPSKTWSVSQQAWQ